MTIPNLIYRTSDTAPIPSSSIVKGVPLTNLEVDGNFRSLQQFSNILFSLISGTTTLSLSNSDYVLTESDSNNTFIKFTGTLSVAINVICPSKSKIYFLFNETNQNITFKTSSGSGITLLPNYKIVVFCDSINVIDAINQLNGNLTGNVIGNLTGNVIGNSDTVTDGVYLNATQTLTNKTIERLILNDGYTEEVFAITDGTTVNLDPNNGSIQTWTLGANRTPGQANWAAGQSITLMVDDGSAATITWTTLGVVWKTNGGSAPTLNTTGFTVIALWKVNTTIYGARVGDA
jgi:hypothetical protein